jgi:hypothetical protein
LKVLLDECVDSRFAEHIRTVEVHTVVGKGWAGITNGKLLALAQAELDVDRNLSFQQHLRLNEDCTPGVSYTLEPAN